MALMKVKNWEQFQHYKDRCPPWVKLHKGLVDDFDFQRLPLASRALAPMLWLIASESMDGEIDCDPDRLAFRLRQDVAEVEAGLSALIEKGFLIPASDVLAKCTPENREQRQRQRQRTETEKEKPAPKTARFDPLTLSLPDSIPADKWGEWISYRRSRKLATTEPTARKQIELLTKCAAEGQRAAEIIDASIANGWQGLFPLKPQPRASPTFKTIAQIRAETVAGLTGCPLPPQHQPRSENVSNIIDGTARLIA